MIKISHWYGRLGNNIQQCAIGYMVSELLQNNFCLDIDHEIISKHFTKFGNNFEDYVSRWFYWEGPYQEVNLSAEYIYSNMRRVCKEHIFKHLQIPQIDPIPDDTIVIHIRSGDIFDQIYPNGHQYTPNPLSFYNKLLEKFDKVIIVTEPDNNNPIIQILKEISKVTIQSKSVSEDFATLLAAKNLASSGVGTFCIAAALCSQNIKNFYCTDLMLTEHLNYSMLLETDITVFKYNLIDYLRVGEWKNTEEQRSYILNYNL